MADHGDRGHGSSGPDQPGAPGPDESHRPRPPSAGRVLVWVVAAILAILAGWVLRATAVVSVPIVFAFFLTVVLAPLDRALTGALPRGLKWLGRTAVMALLLVSLGVFFAGLTYAARQVIAEVPRVASQLEQFVPEEMPAMKELERVVERGTAPPSSPMPNSSETPAAGTAEEGGAPGDEARDARTSPAGTAADTAADTADGTATPDGGGTAEPSGPSAAQDAPPAATNGGDPASAGNGGDPASAANGGDPAGTDGPGSAGGQGAAAGTGPLGLADLPLRDMLNRAGSTAGTWLVEGATALARQVVGAAGTFIAATIIVVFMVLLALSETPAWHGKLRTLWPRASDDWESAFDTISRKLRGFLLVRAATGLLTAALYTGWLWVFDVGLLTVWAVLTFLLAFVPNLGSIISGVLPTLYALVTKDFQTALIVGLGLFVVEQIIGNVVDPRLQGRQIAISPLVVLVSILAWGWIWGAPGALLAVPMMVGLMVVFAHIPALAPLALLLSNQTDRQGLDRALDGG